jgi:putative ABC transport system permease protein
MLTALWSDLRYRLRALFRREVLERDLDAELRYHLEREAEKYEAAGMSPAEARRRAQLAFGGVERAKEEDRDARGTRLLETLMRDVRYAARSLRRTPSLPLVAIPTLALAIGATTALFSFADALLLRPLPVRDPDRLVTLVHVSATDAGSYGSFSYPDYLDLRDARRSAGVDDISAYSDIQVELGNGPDAVPVQAAIVSGNYFSVLGVQPLVGRTFAPEEGSTPGTHPVVVLSEALWVGRFGADRSLIGRSVTVNGRPFTVIGVAPRSTPAPDLSSAPRLWVPLMMHDIVMPMFRIGGLELFGNRGTQWLTLLGRLRPGATRQQADVAFAALARRAAELYPHADKGWTIAALPMGRARTGPPGASPLPHLTMLMAAVIAMVLLLACANVANLLLSRGVAREREMAVRAAVGAGRARLVGQLLTESLLVSILGGAAGVLLAGLAVSALPSLGLTSGLPALDVRLDARVLGFAVLATVVAGLASGLVPALRASTAGVARGSGVSIGPQRGGRDRLPLHQALVGVQVAVSLVLLVGAGLMLRTVWNLRAIPLGYDVHNVRIARIDLPQKGYDAGVPGTDVSGEADGAAWKRVVESVRALPGVRAASVAAVAPFGVWNMANDFFRDDANGARPGDRFNVGVNVVDGDYFATMGVRLVAGRTFNAGDAHRPGVAVVNQALASRLWPGRSPLGMRIRQRDPMDPDRAGEPIEIVGVVSDGRYYRAWRQADRPFLFLPVSQHPQPRMFLHVRGTAAGVPGDPALRRAVWAAQPGWTVAPAEEVAQARAQALAVESAGARLLTLFGLLAVVIAAIGIYGVVSFSVSRRTREMGVRMALGARAADVRRNVVVRSAVPILAGTALGLVTALGLTQSLSSLLYGVSATDAATFAVVTTLLVAVGLLASFVPARRATRVDPVAVMRQE